MRGERPHYEDGDYYCSVCGEPWDTYGVRTALKGEVSDMTKEEAEKFMKGKGCPCCPSRLRDRDLLRQSITPDVEEEPEYPEPEE